MNLAISALNFFYSKVVKTDIIRDLRRPHQDKRLPSVLSEKEIRLILDHTQNPKHKLLLMLIYSSGLRVSEAVTLTRADIDLDRKTVFVRSAKGRKDRYTLLSTRIARAITEYYDNYGITGWLFPGVPAHHHITIRSAQKIFEQALRKSKIQKSVSIHSLRHAFATHLLENGTDIKYIQTLLGHASITTTERYTHVAKNTVLKIRSPLDSIE
jgi:site-specific recombinase XerD